MNFLQDVRFALRGIRKSPGFAVVAMLTLALGIGANTAIFTVINTVFLNPLPVQDARHLVNIYTVDGGLNLVNVNFFPVSLPNARDIAREIDAFSGTTIGTFNSAPVSMTINGQPDQYFADVVTANFFEVLGVKAGLGRTFRPEEDHEGAPGVVVLSYGLWERKFGSNRDVIGQSVLLNGQGYSIIGVAPRGFQGAAVLGGPDMWVTMSMHDQLFSGLQKTMFNERRFLGFSLIARLKDNVTPEQARQQLKTLGLTLEQGFPVANKGRNFLMMPLLESSINPNLRGFLTLGTTVLMTVVGLVLLIACANIANLLLARAAGRKREISIRVAMGASRWRIIAQLLTESTVLALTGGALGLGLAVIGRNLLWNMRPPFLANSFTVPLLDNRVLLFNLVIALATGLIFGLVPALQSSRPNLVSELKERTGTDAFSSRTFSVRNVFIMVQVGLSLVALIGAGLFLLSLRNAQQMDPGFDTRNLGMISFDVGSLNYDAARTKEFQRRALEAAQTTPGVQAATLSNAVPLFNGGFGRSVVPEGRDPNASRSGMFAQVDSISPQFLQTMHIPILRGNGFDNTVREDSPKMAIVNEAAAKRFWPNDDPIGKRFKFFGADEWVQVIGVARDSKYNSLGENPQPYMYLSLLQYPSPAVTLLIRTGPQTQSVLGDLRPRIQQLDRNLPLTNVWPITEVFDQALWAARFSASLLGVFAVIAMALCMVGIYGVVSYAVGQRVREIGVRLALGAQPGEILLMVLRQSAVTMLIGLGGGLIVAVFLARFIVSLLYGVSANEPLAYVALVLTLSLVGLAASYIPARRAAKVDPVVALHYE